MQLLNDADGEPAEQAAHQQSSQYIRWIMYIQIHTGKGDKPCVERHAMSKKCPKTKKAEKSRENTEKSQFYVEFHAKLSEKTQKIA